MALTRDNHFVPQFYLRNFGSASGEVCEYRTLVSHSSVARWKRVNVAGTGYEKNLYTRIRHGEETDDIEQWLNREFETPAKEPLQKVLTGEEPTSGDLQILVRFLAAQIVRTPAFLVRNLPIWRQMAPEVLRETANRAQEALKAAALGEQVDIENPPHAEFFPVKTEQVDLTDRKLVQFTTTLTVDRRLWFYSMKHTLTDTLKVLYGHKWTILKAPKGLEWFTSDDPVILLNYRSESDYDFNGGWNRPLGNILLPLSPRHLMFTEMGAGPYPEKVPSGQHARLFQRMIAEHAYHRIYSLTEDDRIPKLRKHREDGQAFQNDRALWADIYEDHWKTERTR